jgi:hypothetical protein
MLVAGCWLLAAGARGPLLLPATTNQQPTRYTFPSPPTTRLPMSDPDPADTVRQLAELRQEHRDLDVLIDALHNRPMLDELAVKRMKKRKLKLKDMIAQLESRLIPDIDA